LRDFSGHNTVKPIHLHDPKEVLGGSARHSEAVLGIAFVDELVVKRTRWYEK
jgi:hypothetical protein